MILRNFSKLKEKDFVSASTLPTNLENYLTYYGPDVTCDRWGNATSFERPALDLLDSLKLGHKGYALGALASTAASAACLSHSTKFGGINLGIAAAMFAYNYVRRGNEIRAVKDSLSIIDELKKESFCRLEALDYGDIPPSFIDNIRFIGKPREFYCPTGYVRFTPSYSTGPIQHIPNIQNGSLITTGIVTGHAENKESRSLVLSSLDNKNNLICKYGTYNLNKNVRKSRLYRCALSDGLGNADGGIAADTSELVAMVDSFQNTGQNLIIGGRISNGSFNADMFRFNNILFTYLLVSDHSGKEHLTYM